MARRLKNGITLHGAMCDLISIAALHIQRREIMIVRFYEHVPGTCRFFFCCIPPVRGSVRSWVDEAANVGRIRNRASESRGCRPLADVRPIVVRKQTPVCFTAFEDTSEALELTLPAHTRHTLCYPWLVLITNTQIYTPLPHVKVLIVQLASTAWTWGASSQQRARLEFDFAPKLYSKTFALYV